MGLTFRWICFLFLVLAAAYSTTTLLGNDAPADPTFAHFPDSVPSHALDQEIDLRPSHTKQVTNGNLLVQHLPRQQPPNRRQVPHDCLYHSEMPVCNPGIKQRESASPDPDYHVYCRYHPGLQMCKSKAIQQRQSIDGDDHRCVYHPELQRKVCPPGIKHRKSSPGLPHYWLHEERPECSPTAVKTKDPVAGDIDDDQTENSIAKRHETGCTKIFGIFWWSTCSDKGGPLFPINEDSDGKGGDNNGDEDGESNEEWDDGQSMELIEWKDWQDFQEWLDQYGNMDFDFEELAERSSIHRPGLATSDTQFLDSKHADHFIVRPPLPRPTHRSRTPLKSIPIARMVPSFPPPMKETGVITTHHSTPHFSFAEATAPLEIAHLFKAESDNTNKKASSEHGNTQQSAPAGTPAAENTLFTNILLYVLLGLICFGILSLAVFIAARRFMKNSSWTPRNDCPEPLTPAKFSSVLGATADDRGAYVSTRVADEEAQRPMMERRFGTGLDGVNDGWTKWVQQKCGAEIHIQERASSTPRIPSLTLPKPTFATVRKVSGLPDLDGASAHKPQPSARVKRLSKVMRTSTV